MLKKIFLLALLLTSCLSEAPVAPAYPPPDTDFCGRMCAKLETLGCEEGKPLYNSDIPGLADIPNQTCTDWCQEMQVKGFFVNPRCVALVTRCDDIESYRQKSPTQCQ